MIPRFITSQEFKRTSRNNSRSSCESRISILCSCKTPDPNVDIHHKKRSNSPLTTEARPW
jgi:hypothetical protein